MRLHLRQRGDRLTRKAEIGHHLAQCGAIGGGQDEGARRIMASVGVERCLGRQHLGALKAEAEADQLVVGGVIDQHHGPRRR